MKLSIWDILTGVTLLGIVVMIGVFGFLLINRNPTQVASAQATAMPTIFIPTSTITNTPVPPTATFTPTPTRRPWSTATPIPTNTPFKLPSFTASPRPAGVGGSSQNKCLVTEQKPMDGEYMARDTAFETKWTIQNTSGKAWARDTIDIKWISGDTVHSSPKVMDLPYDVASQSKVEILVGFKPIGVPGDYSSYWGMYDGDTVICRFFVKFRIP